MAQAPKCKGCGKAHFGLCDSAKAMVEARGHLDMGMVQKAIPEKIKEVVKRGSTEGRTRPDEGMATQPARGGCGVSNAKTPENLNTNAPKQVSNPVPAKSAKVKAWRERNPEKYREYMKRYMKKRRGK